MGELEEIEGDIWKIPRHWVVITTNGERSRYGQAIMGAGVALCAKRTWPVLLRDLGENLAKYGNHVFVFPQYGVITFPTKHLWRNPSDLTLIAVSALQLRTLMISGLLGGKILMPRPGCGCGGLDWVSQVRPIIANYLSGLVTIVHKIEITPEQPQEGP